MKKFLLLLFFLASLPAYGASGPLGGLAIGGYDPVSYVDEGKTIEGEPRYISTSDFMVYHFRSQKNLDLFLADKDKYTPEFGGNCAYQAALGKIVTADPNIWAMLRGKLYFSRGGDSRDTCFMNPPKYRREGEITWAHYTDTPVPPDPGAAPPTTLIPPEFALPMEELGSITTPPPKGEHHAKKLYRKGLRVQP